MSVVPYVTDRTAPRVICFEIWDILPLSLFIRHDLCEESSPCGHFWTLDWTLETWSFLVKSTLEKPLESLHLNSFRAIELIHFENPNILPRRIRIFGRGILYFLTSGVKPMASALLPIISIAFFGWIISILIKFMSLVVVAEESKVEKRERGGRVGVEWRCGQFSITNLSNREGKRQLNVICIGGHFCNPMTWNLTQLGPECDTFD